MIRRSQAIDWTAKDDETIRNKWMVLTAMEIGTLLGYDGRCVRERAEHLGLPRMSSDRARLAQLKSDAAKRRKAEGTAKYGNNEGGTWSEHDTRAATIKLELAICDLADKLGVDLLPYNAAA